MAVIDTLVVVACHAIYLGGPTDGRDESEWLIEPFQVGETSTFMEHIRRGVEELDRVGNQSLLTFSGGATKRLKTGGKVTRTEAEGYADIASRRNFFGLGTEKHDGSNNLRSRMFEERYATDSYQNILLSLVQYSLWSVRLRNKDEGRLSAAEHNSQEIDDLILPKRLVIISHEFKRARFLDLHLPAIRSIWPSTAEFDQMVVDYIGINPPFDEQKIQEIEEGDRKRGYGVWKDDLLGNGTVLSGKRMERGWDEAVFLRDLKGWFSEAALTKIEQMLRRKS